MKCSYMDVNQSAGINPDKRTDSRELVLIGDREDLWEKLRARMDKSHNVGIQTTRVHQPLPLPDSVNDRELGNQDRFRPDIGFIGQISAVINPKKTKHLSQTYKLQLTWLCGFVRCLQLKAVREVHNTHPVSTRIAGAQFLITTISHPSSS